MKKYAVLILMLLLIPYNCFALSESARSSVIMDINSGRVLYEKNKNEKMLIASITKIMTCIVVLENTKLEDTVKVGEEVLKMYGTSIYVEVGEEMKVKDLLYGLMLRSGNDAAVALATYVAGSEDEFVKMMNKKAEEIGMKNTVFENSHGLDESTQNYSTSYDMALLSRYAYNNDTYRQIVSTKKYSAKSSTKSYIWYNRMTLLINYKNCIGGKNGYTPSAGKTLVSLAKKDNLILTVVSLDDGDIYENHTNMYENIFKKYKMYTILDKNNFKINSSLIKDSVYIKDSFEYPLSEDEVDNIYTFIRLFNETKNNVVGEIIITLNKDEIGRFNIYKKAEKKDELSIFQKIKNLFLRNSKQTN